VGAENPTLRMVIYTDTDCPFCKRYESVLDQLLERHGDQVSVTYRNFDLPIHKYVRLEHHALECVGMLADSKTYRAFQNETAFQQQIF